MGVIGIRKEIWTGYDGDIDVEFSKEDGKVIDKYYKKTSIWPKPTWLERIKRPFVEAFSAAS